MKKIALISVSDKTGIVEFAKELRELNYEILATGRTASLLKENDVLCTEISDYTSSPEIFDGRVKTLHPKIFGGILFRRNHSKDIVEAEKNSIEQIDIVCVNLYPFPEVVKKEGAELSEKIENIDIGGPSLIRASSKNYKYVSVLTKPSQYSSFIDELKGGSVSLETRQRLAYEAFDLTSYYDSVIANFLEKEFDQEPLSIRENHRVQRRLRYGENPHQEALLAGDFFDYFEILGGKEISYNNIVDLNAAVELIEDMEPNSCAIVKHTNPCGAATRGSACEAYSEALSSDPVSAYGGIVCFNSTIDLKTAEKLNEIFLEIVAAPDYTPDALEELKKKKNRRVLRMLKPVSDQKYLYKSVAGGMIFQQKDSSKIENAVLKTVTKKSPTEAELSDLKFAWVISKHTKSNAIVYVKDKKIISCGAGQTSRVDSAWVAATKAKNLGHNLEGAVAASDAFFPFADGLEEIASHGITAVIQPGGSVRDDQVIQAADSKGVAMVFTGIRNFKH